MFGVGHAPEAGMLPTTRSEFIEKRDAVLCFDGAEHRAIAGRQTLIAAPPFARVKNAIAVVRRAIRVARIDAPEIREQ